MGDTPTIKGVRRPTILVICSRSCCTPIRGESCQAGGLPAREENVVFMALSANTQPHFTTIAGFVSGTGPEARRLFRDVLLVCDEEGLIGREMFAVDGVKLPSTASKEWSGTREDFTRKAKPKGSKGEERLGASGEPVKSNLTDEDSALMSSSHGVMPGYTGVTIVDDRHRIIVNAEAFGQGLEAARFRGRKLQCQGCERRQRCIRKPDTTPYRTVTFVGAKVRTAPGPVDWMRAKIDSARRNAQYAKRLATAEPPFANIRSTLGLDRFPLRGKPKVNAQGLLYTVVHNIGKSHRYAYAQ